MERWYLKFKADDVLYIIKKKGMPDGRFRSGTLTGQLQDIFFTAKNCGITLKKKDLMALWEKQYGQSHELIMLQKQHRALLQTRKNISRRLKDIRDAINKWELKHDQT